MARALVEDGCAVQFWLSKGGDEAYFQKAGEDYHVLSRDYTDPGMAQLVCSRAKEQNIGLLLIDSYRIESSAIRCVRRRCPTLPVMVFDDGGEKNGLPVQGVINGNLGSESLNYELNREGLVLQGIYYFPLSGELEQAKPRAKRTSGSVNKIFLCMGGSDPEGQTLRLINILKGRIDQEIVDVVLGPYFGPSAEIKDAIGSDPRFVLHQDPTELGILMSRADLAIAAGGMICAELVYFETPSLVLTLADNQEPGAGAVADNGCGISLGRFDSLTDQVIGETLTSLLDRPDLLKSMRSACKRLIDGQGSVRIAREVVDYLDRFHLDDVLPGEVVGEYSRASSADQEFQKVLWGSEAGMRNRFLLARDTVCWEVVRSWLDVGCGTGTFFETIYKQTAIPKCVGIDLCPEMVGWASAKETAKRNGWSFLEQDFMEQVPSAPFDLVTCIGVLQKCGTPLYKSVARLAELTAPGGQVFVTTKNLDWIKLQEPEFTPYPGHHWFHIQDIKNAFRAAGMFIRKIQGFEPREEGRRLPPLKAHSVYVLAEKEDI